MRRIVNVWGLQRYFDRCMLCLYSRRDSVFPQCSRVNGVLRDYVRYRRQCVPTCPAAVLLRERHSRWRPLHRRYSLPLKDRCVGGDISNSRPCWFHRNLLPLPRTTHHLWIGLVSLSFSRQAFRAEHSTRPCQLGCADLRRLRKDVAYRTRDAKPVVCGPWWHCARGKTGSASRNRRMHGGSGVNYVK
ncbi:hypothetical protein BD310DRAFT_932306 [Dichomitus squalens]|uniref:Uncharacterized protein n=1 Tax=Dichomitus squalens TaxID=114155 RepID=A0A4Q9PPJ1_9APHY|nr:hypothetical protein BD310DRAFT_932306 [Dichomitus squalens]